MIEDEDFGELEIKYPTSTYILDKDTLAVKCASINKVVYMELSADEKIKQDMIDAAKRCLWTYAVQGGGELL